jgi:hypothetical protein
MKYQELKGYKYELVESLTTQTGIYDASTTLYSGGVYYATLSPDGFLTIHWGYQWDGMSGVGDSKQSMRASLVHDVLYQMMRAELLDRKYKDVADRLFEKILIEDGASKLNAWICYQGVKMFGKKSTYPEKKRRGKIIEI